MRSNFRTNKFLYAVFLLFFIYVSIFGSTCVCAAPDRPSEGSGKVVRVGWYDSPFNYIDNNGRRTGYAYEYQKKIAAYTGWSYEYVTGSWVELMDMLRRGEIDLMSDVSFTEKRAADMIFSSQPMGIEEYFIYIDTGRRDIDPDDFSTLNGKRIGINRGSVQEKCFISWADEHDIHAEIVHLDGTGKEAVKALSDGEIDAIVNVPAFALYNENIYPIAMVGSSQFYFVLSNNRSDLYMELDSAMNQIQSLNRYYTKQLNEKYLSSENAFRFLPVREAEWLDYHGKIRVGYWEHYLPFCDRDENTGELTGFLDECLKRISTSMRNAHVEFEPVPYKTLEAAMEGLHNGEIDCVFPITLDLHTADEQKALVTEPFGTSGVIALIRMKGRGEFNPLGVKRAAVESGNIWMQSVISEDFPTWETVVCDSEEDCIKAVIDGKADCFLVSNYRLNRLMGAVGRNGLVPVSTGKTVNLAFAVRKDNVMLYSILGRMTNTLSDADIYSWLGRYSYVDRKVSLWGYIREHFLLTLSILVAIIAVISIMFIRSVRARERAQILNKELEKAREAAEAANSAKTSFLFNMSHDIRTPMNAIMGFRDLLEKHQDEPEMRAHYLEQIKDASGVLLSIINNVLEMARIEKGTIVLDEMPLEVEKFANNVFSVFQELMDEKEIKYTMHLNNKTKYVYCDATKTNAVFINILSNANKYTGVGGSVHFQLDELPSEKEGWTVFRTTISDTGIGMSEDFLPHIFEEFSREQNTTHNKIEGTGLGMPIVKRLVEFMKGTIEVKSKKGVGTTFIVTFPLRIAQNAADHQPGVVEVNPEQFKGKRILLAEDNEINAEIAKAILGEVGFDIDCAEDGNICVNMLAEAPAHTYDVILMDIQMPNMDGYEAARTIRAMDDVEKANIPILAMTANAFEEDKRNAFDAGMNGHIAKPIDVKLLMSELARVLFR